MRLLVENAIDDRTEEDFLHDILCRHPTEFAQGNHILTLIIIAYLMRQHGTRKGAPQTDAFALTVTFAGIFYLIRMHYFYIMCKYEEALQCGRRASQCLPSFKGLREEQEYYYIYSLTLLAVCKTSISTAQETREIFTTMDQAAGTTACQQSTNQLLSEEYAKFISIVVENQKKFKKWCDAAEMNFRHQYLLVEAELARVR